MGCSSSSQKSSDSAPANGAATAAAQNKDKNPKAKSGAKDAPAKDAPKSGGKSSAASSTLPVSAAPASSAAEETSIEVLQPFAVDQLSYRGDESSPRQPASQRSSDPKRPSSRAKPPSVTKSDSTKRLKEVQATPGIRAKVQAAAAAKRRASLEGNDSPLATQSGAVWTVPLGDANLSRGSSKRSLAPLDGSGTGSLRGSPGVNSLGKSGGVSSARAFGQKASFLENDRNFASEGKDAELLLAISRDRMDQIRNPKMVVKADGSGNFTKAVGHDAASGATFLDPNDDFEDDIQLVR